MSLDFGTGQILTAIQLCYQVYARCQSSRGEFKSLSIQTHTIREILQIIESRRSNMTAQNYATLQPIVDRLVQLLRETTRRLTEYHSLGTATPGVWDKMRWAMDGGSKEVRAELDSLLGQLTAINTSISEQRADTIMPQQPHFQESRIARKPIHVAVPQLSPALLTSPSMPTKNLTPFVNIDDGDNNNNNNNNNNDTPPPSPMQPYQLGPHSIIDACQFLLFCILTLLSFALVLVLGGFYTVTLVLFPFVEIVTGFTRTREHWKRFNDFYAHLFSRLFNFGSGLWD